MFDKFPPNPCPPFLLCGFHPHPLDHQTEMGCRELWESWRRWLIIKVEFPPSTDDDDDGDDEDDEGDDYNNDAFDDDDGDDGDA